MPFIADLHIHSHYSMATSKDANPENLYRWACYKGVTLVGSGDFTHPGWRQELQDKLEPAGEGLYQLKDELCRQVEKDSLAELTAAGLQWRGSPAGAWAMGEAATAGSSYLTLDATGRPVVRFIISGEISTIYKQGGRTRKVHHLILLPSLEAAAELSRRLEEIGNLHSDGRPILGLDSRRLLEMTLEACPEAIFIPAHIWTPHFSLFGANSGFDAIEECYGDLARHIFAVETGLSSDPPMNWRLAALDRLTLVSNSDAHSPRHLAREANLFNTDLSYPALRRALEDPGGDGFRGTLEFFPEEGKYHYDGHRNCQVCWQPVQTRAAGGICPVCGRKLTIGVLHRVEELADREAGFRPGGARPFASLVPLPEVIAAALGMGVASKRVTRAYFNLIGTLGPELPVLREVPLEAIARVAGSLVAAAIRRMRTGEVEVHPGFDGEYGKVFLLRPEERQLLSEEPRLFIEDAAVAPVAATGEGRSEMALPGPASATTEKSAPDSPGRWGPVLKGGVLVPIPDPSSTPAGPADQQPLNPEQQAAVVATDGPVVVVAGPGTGKTRTLVYRLAYLIQERGVAPGEIAAVTFTNKAAAEIRQRVADLLGDRQGLSALTVGTFHSICLDLLQAGLQLGAGRSLTIIDEVDAREILAEVLAEAQGRGRRGVTALQRQISLLKGRGLFPDAPDVPDDLRPLFRSYQERLAAYGLLDYDDILLQALEFPKLTPEVPGTDKREQDGDRGTVPFTHLLVDEFQDVNAVQYQLVKKWAGNGKNLFVIGDPDQAIYGFRGADYRFFGQLLQDFPVARLFHLHRNYRSTPVVLRAAAGVVAHNPAEGPLSVTRSELAAAYLEPTTAQPVPAALSEPASEAAPEVTPPGRLPFKVTGTAGEAAPRVSRPQGSPIIYLEAPGETAAGIAIVREIGRLIGGTTMLQAHGQGRGAKRGGLEPGDEESYGFSDIAVLCRTGRQLQFLEECFLKEGLPYRIVGRESFLEAAPVRQALAFCRCLVNPGDDFYLRQCLAGHQGISRETAARIGELARRQGSPLWQVLGELAGGGGNRPPAAVAPALEAFPCGPALRSRLQAFIDTLTTCRAARGGHSPADLLARWAKEKGLLNEESLNRLIRVAAGFSDLSSFLRGVVLAGEADHERRGPRDLSPEVITLMTLHAAKGLEFPVVFIAGLEDGVLPLRERQGANLTPEEMAEERRLFYVGMTRARKLLYLVAARRREQGGATVPAEPSPFLQEIPAGCLVARAWEGRGKSKGSNDGVEDDAQYKQLSLF
ncbi:DNA helicase [Moorella sp. Hama-1]|nr:DNA helicase [Moorella sp. Hama-1]